MNSLFLKTKFWGLEISELIYILIFTVLTIVLHGYGYGVGDQVLHIPLLHKLNDHTLFPTDYIFPLIYSHRTFIYNLVLLFSQFFRGDLFIPYLIFYIITQAFWYIGIYKLALVLTRNKKVAVLSCLLFIFPYPVGGAAITTIETSFVLRTLTNTLLVFMLVYLFEKKYWRVFILLAITIFIHPLSGAVFGLLFIPLLGYLLRGHRKMLVSGMIINVTGFFVAVLEQKSNNVLEVLPLRPPTEWINILTLRNSYAFPALWSTKQWVFLFISLCPLIFHMLKRANRRLLSQNVIIRSLFIITIVLFLIQYFFTSVFPVSYVIILQLGRIWLVPIILSFILGMQLAANLLRRYLPSLWMTRVILLTGLVILIAFKSQPVLITAHADWREIQFWVKDHTTAGCTVLTDFYSQGFRVYSQRNIIGEYKDGTVSFYSPDFAHNWNKRLQLLANVKDLRDTEILNRIQKIYPFSLVVLPTDLPTDVDTILLPLYRNESFAVYQLPTIEQKCRLL